MSEAGPPVPPRSRRSFVPSIAPLVVGGLLGFIGGYFAGGGGRPAPPSSAAAASPEASGRLDALKAEADRDPQNPKVLAALGNAYYDREDWDHAIETYERALRKAPKDAAVLSDLGAAYRNRGEFKRAIACFRRARAADPDHWQSLLNTVLVYAFDAKDADRAQKAFDELKRRYPDIPNIDRLQEQISRLRAG